MPYLFTTLLSTVERELNFLFLLPPLPLRTKTGTSVMAVVDVMKVSNRITVYCNLREFPLIQENLGFTIRACAL